MHEWCFHVQKLFFKKKYIELTKNYERPQHTNRELTSNAVVCAL